MGGRQGARGIRLQAGKQQGNHAHCGQNAYLRHHQGHVTGEPAQEELAQQDKFTLKLVNDQVDTCADALYQAICQRIGAAE